MNVTHGLRLKESATDKWQALNFSKTYCLCNDKKGNQIFLIYEEIQNGAVAKSHMTNGQRPPHIW